MNSLYQSEEFKKLNLDTSMKRKVLFFLFSNIGGAERMTITIAKYLPIDKYEVKFVIVDRSMNTVEHFIPQGYEYRFVKIRNIWDFVTIRLINVMKEEQPYAVFSSVQALNVRVQNAAHFVGGIKIVSRNDNYWSTLRWDKFLLCKFSYRFADVIIAQQEEMKDDIINNVKVAPEKVFTLHNPIDTELIEMKSQSPSPYPHDDSVNYVWVARFLPTKGQDILVEAFIKVAKENPKAHLYFVGRPDRNGIFYNKVINIANKSEYAERIHFVGYSNNPYCWIKNSDCFVLPSRIEGLPNSLVEAQYLGVPCVATCCIPMIKRIISDGVNGYITPNEDCDALAKAMLKAPSLGKIKITYKSANKQDFINLF